MPFCTKCGTEASENAKFCNKCGNSLQSRQKPSQIGKTAPAANAGVDTGVGALSEREQNIEKNRQFEAVIKRNLIKSIFIAVIAIISIIFIAESNFFPNGLPALFIILIILAICGIPIIVGRALFAGGCEKCAAKWYEKRLSNDLISEQFIGNKTEKDPIGKGFTAGGYTSRKEYTKYAVFNRRYAFRSRCVYCGYEWTGEYTTQEKEEI